MPKLKYPEPPEADLQFSFRRLRSDKHRFIRDKTIFTHVDLETNAYETSTVFSNSENTFQLTISTSARPKSKRKDMAHFHSWPSSRAVGADDPLPEDDVRACPRDVEDFKLAVAFELDRLREKKAIRDE